MAFGIKIVHSHNFIRILRLSLIKYILNCAFLGARKANGGHFEIKDGGLTAN